MKQYLYMCIKHVVRLIFLISLFQVKDVRKLSQLKTLKIGNFREEETTEAIREELLKINGKMLVYYHLSEVM